ASASGAASSPRTTSSSCGLFKNERRLVPKWYAKAPKRSGRRATWGFSRQRPSSWVSASSIGALGRRGLVDAAHPVDRDVLDQQVLLDQLLALGLGDRPGRLVWCRSHEILLDGLRSRKSYSTECQMSIGRPPSTTREEIEAVA